MAPSSVLGKFARGRGLKHGHMSRTAHRNGLKLTAGHMNALTIFRQAQSQQDMLPRNWVLPGFGQIGILVDDPEAASTVWGPRLGVTAWYRPHFTKCRAWTDERPLNQSFDIIVGYAERTQIELVHVGGPDTGIFAHPSPGDSPEIHHLGYFVRDFDRRVQDLRDIGQEPSQFGTLRLARGVVTRLAYWDLRASGGGIVELIEQRVMRVRMGMPERLIQLGVLTGRCERLR